MTANQALLLFLVLFWGGLAVAVKVSNLLSGKRWTDGPSLIPVIPLFPLAAGLVGWLVNWIASPWGAWSIGALHIGWLVAAGVGQFRHRPPRSVDDA